MADPILVNLGTHPRHPYPFLWADYIELITLCSRDGQFSRGALAEADQEGGDLQQEGAEENENPEETEGPESTEKGKLSAVKRDDTISLRWDEIKRRLQQRSETYAYWPFELRGNVLVRRFNPANPGHRLYAALLIASSYRLCHDKRAGEVAAALEEVAVLLMQNMLGKGWTVKPFGAHQSIAVGYTGTLRSKLEKLAQDVHGVLMKSEDDYDKSDTGDGGLDVVAWDSLGDSRGHFPVIFAQCGCSPTDWEHKQLSVTPAAVEAHIKTQHPAAAWYVTPHDLSQSNNKWDRGSHVVNVVLLDRKRLLHLVQRHELDPIIPTWPFVSEAANLGYSLTA